MSEHEPRNRPARPTGKIVVPASHHPAPPPSEESPVNARDLASASRSCLAIIVILIILVLFACVAIAIRGAMG